MALKARSSAKMCGSGLTSRKRFSRNYGKYQGMERGRISQKTIYIKMSSGMKISEMALKGRNYAQCVDVDNEVHKTDNHREL